MKSAKHLQFLVWALVMVLFQNCKLADLRTTTVQDGIPQREPKAVALLETVIQNQNLGVLENSKTYSLQLTDNWRGLSALVNPFPRDNKPLTISFTPKTFDAQFHYTNIRNQKTYGVEGANFYVIKKEGEKKFKKKRSMVFSLAALQYLLELPLRLREAEILKYAGSTVFEGKAYDLVFASWQSVAPNTEFDQYLLYISKETGHLRFASYTVRGNYLPAPKSIYGTIRYENFKKDASGVHYASTLHIQLNQLKQKRRSTRLITMSDFNLQR